jgi:uncharacterized protein YabE (DUF348 family)
MTNLFHKFFVLSGVFLLLCLAVLFIGGVASTYVRAAGVATESGERLLTIHDGSEDRGILTRATTLRQAFKEAGIPIDSNDLVEPGLDETLMANNYDVNLYRARPVMVIDGAVRKKIMSAYRTPDQIVTHAGIELHDEDLTTMERPLDFASQGAAIQLTISRATSFTLVLYGKKMTAYTQAQTVAGMLEAKKITLGKDDMLSVSGTEPIRAGMTVELWREGKQTVTEEEEVPFGIEQVRDMDRDLGYREIKTPGVPGKRSVTYEIEMRNGVEVSRKEIQSVTIDEPKKQTEVVGGKVKASLSPAEAQALGHQMMLAFGFGEDQWSCLQQLWMRESGWRTTAANPSGAYGIPQALPGSKMGPGWQTDASVQIQWGLGYIKNRYQTPCGAWSAFQSKGWY